MSWWNRITLRPLADNPEHGYLQRQDMIAYMD